MPFCPKCKSEYLPEIKVCADCEIDLVEQLPQEKEKEEEVTLELEEVYISYDPIEAGLIGQLLEDNNITYFIREIEMYPFPVTIGKGQEKRIIVDKLKKDEAIALIKDFVESKKYVQSNLFEK